MNLKKIQIPLLCLDEQNPDLSPSEKINKKINNTSFIFAFNKVNICLYKNKVKKKSPLADVCLILFISIFNIPSFNTIVFIIENFEIINGHKRK